MGFKFNPLTGQFDLVSVAGGGGGSQYSEPFNATTDWSGPVNDSYSVTILQAAHGKTNPIVQVFEEDGSDYIQVETGVRIDSSYNVTITVNSIPDLRFAGKIIIS